MVESQYIATMDDDDLSLPNRLSTQLQSIGKGVYHRTGMVFVAVDELFNIIGQKLGLYHGTMMILREVALELKWKESNWCEDHHLFTLMQKHPQYSKKIVQTAHTFYVVRRHGVDRASSMYGKGSEKDKLEIDFETEESEKAVGIVKEILAIVPDSILAIA
eukprot:TRINITY_DN3362_c0_g1_i2.p1 TRINITY_DN3362_c0_g1~~TRINITY_DN3362_c0_g1_i2.p1  ORF type:complete len:161 (-),score=31.75 TRINITY_DN3362_c0_g1_i2:303-785(-)